jgi:pyruvate/2-oxoglutarate/acetoin dehydrogenase E1 component
MTQVSATAAEGRRNRIERKLTIAKAMQEAVAQEMRRDSNVFFMGEDVGTLGGVWGNTQGLLEEFGPTRVRDTPISETAFISAAVGAASLGMRPIVELTFVDFFGVCMDAIYNLAAKNLYHSAGRVKTAMVITTGVGGGYSDATQHSQCLYGTFAHLPGLKVVIPSNAYDAKGLLLSAIRDDGPVMYMQHKNLQGMGFLGTVKGTIVDVPEEPYTIPLGVANIVREGRDLTIVGLGATVHQALDAAQSLASEGIDAEVIDLRSLVPLDRDTVLRSIRKTGRLLAVDEDYISFGVTSELLALASENAFNDLKCAPRRIAYPDIPPPYARPMEHFALPNAEKIITAARQMIK